MGYMRLLYSILCAQCLLFHVPSNSYPFGPSCQHDQSSALLQFKSSLTIDSIASFLCDEPYHDVSTSYTKTRSWENGTDCCSWHGVRCDAMSGNVVGLDLSCSMLQGQILPNSSLFRLTHLERLNLAYNDFAESLMPSEFGKLVRLTHLNLSSSGFSGQIPSEISHLSKLVSLDLYDFDNPFRLSIQPPIWKRLMQNATALRDLSLDGVDMSSIRPNSFSDVNLSSSLVTLRLALTGLEGNFMSYLFHLPNLQELDLSNNVIGQVQLPKSNFSSPLRILNLQSCQIQGSIPSLFSNLTQLTYLSLSSNKLKGEIPSSLLSLPHLIFLDLSTNNLRGQIPDVFGHSNKLEELNFADNSIGGQLPSSLSNLQHLTSLVCSSNNLSGHIPDVFSKLSKLEMLSLKNNNLRGQLPSSLFDLAQLSILDCSFNKLAGPLPNNITGFSSLTHLLLSNNFLNETIPWWCLSLPPLSNLRLSNNQFTGHIGAISSYSLEYLYLCGNKLQGSFPKSIFNLVNLTLLCLSSNNLSGHINFQLFFKLPKLQVLSLSQNLLSVDFETNVNYSFSSLQELELSSCNLTNFPKFLGRFPELKNLDLSNNILHGKVPKWLHESHSLKYLNLSQNMLTSMDQFSWNYLSHLDLSFNSFAGDISLSICNASYLQILNLSHNKFTGTIPDCLGNLSHLLVLDLQMNKLYGTLPKYNSDNNVLTTLNLNGNQLEGPLPQSLSRCKQLVFLNLGNNQIDDTFPHWLQALPRLRVLVLKANKFSGPVTTNSKTKHPFSKLIIFDVSDNNFSGPLPAAYIRNFNAMMKDVKVKSSLQYVKVDYTIFQYADDPDLEVSYNDSVVVTTKGISVTMEKILATFAAIDLSKNRFVGEIPEVVGELHALKGLNLSYNRLIGPIPPSIGRLTNLESLDLSSNMLTGGIPTELTNLNYLEALNLSQNQLVGPIPQGKQFNTFSNDSYQGNLGLCGYPLTRKCNDDPSKEQTSSSRNSSYEHEFGFGWKPVALGYGCGMVFGVVLGCCVFITGKPQWLVRIVQGGPNKRVRRTSTRAAANHDRRNSLVQME